MSVSREQRHLRNSPCPVCSGYEEAPRGQGKRCEGFTSADGEWCNCARSELAGAIDQNDAGLFGHKMHGSCKCGVQHGAPHTEEPEAVYDYNDEAGTLLFQVVRKPGKKFLQRRPDGFGGWIWKTGDVRMVLYRLPQLLAADLSTPVYVVEGEKDADAGARAGLLTTCNPRGAGKWGPVFDLARKTLAGRSVIVVADKDKPGRTHAAAVVTCLTGAATSVVAVEAPVAKDLAAHLSAGGDVGSLVPMVLEDVPPDLDDFDNVFEFEDPKVKGKRRKKKVQEPRPAGEPWEDELLWNPGRDGETRLEVNLRNAALLLANAPGWAGTLAYDEFACRSIITAACPAESDGPFPRTWSDVHDLRATAWLQACKWRLNIGLETVTSAAKLVSHQRKVHPLRERLLALAWDGQPRADAWLITYLGAADTPFHRDVGRKWLLSLVARVMQPGCKADYTLILEGKQGQMKSSALRILSLGYFADDIPELGTKDSAIHLQGLWLIEMAELASMSRTEINRLKAFVTRQSDRYRGVWSKYAEDHPRQCGFAGSTNEDDYLKDPTGGRRWWPVPVGTVELAALERDVEQLWAEVVADFHDGREWWLSSEAAHERAADVQAERYEGDVWDDQIAKFVAGDPTTTVHGILSTLFEIKSRDQDRAAQMRVSKCLKNLGWTRKKCGPRHARSWIYFNPDVVAPTPPVTQPVGTHVGSPNGQAF